MDKVEEKSEGLPVNRAKKRMSFEQIIKKRQERAAMPGAFVLISNTLESRWLLTKIRDYDLLVNWVQRHIGRTNVDSTKALQLIEKCQGLERSFNAMIQDLAEFVSQYEERFIPKNFIRVEKSETAPDTTMSSPEVTEVRKKKAV